MSHTKIENKSSEKKTEKNAEKNAEAGHSASLSISRLGEVYILLQMACELKCKVCPYWGVNGACNDDVFKKKYVDAGKMDLARLKQFVDEVSVYRPKIITLSGGEPLLYEGWVELAKYIKSKDIKVSLSTNGLHIAKYLKEIMLYVDDIQISLGGTKEILTKTRGANYGFDTVVSGLKKMAKLKKVLNQKTPFVKIIYVVSDLSYRHLREFYDYFLEQKISIDNFYFQHMMYSSKELLDLQRSEVGKLGGEVLLWDGFEYVVGKMDVEYLLDQMHYLSRFKNVTFSPKITEDEVRSYYDPRLKAGVKRESMCRAPWSQVDLYPNGDIMTCPDIVLGNIFKESFKNIWAGKKARQLREYILKNKRFPACQSCFYYYVTNEDVLKT